MIVFPRKSENDTFESAILESVKIESARASAWAPHCVFSMNLKRVPSRLSNITTNDIKQHKTQMCVVL